MPTLNAIIKEIKDVPVNQLEELYQLVRSLTKKIKKTERSRNKILSFGGAFKDMSDIDYADMVKEMNRTRGDLFAT
jgi:hypothetical protein